MIEFMLDADICIYLMSKRHPELNKRAEAAGEAVCISTVALAELRFGVENSDRQAANRRELDGFVADLEIMDFDAAAAQHYGEIRAALRRAGTPVGSNDLLIGAHARSLGLTLVTNNRREFDRMPGLKVENWV